ncbi:hypothetical protein [Polaromonas sp.]|uniref:hypothetical protein n=1 Tax=Polaromonas sp. TaxID=1869339 RepID=UPI002731D461|nr:hypothetical protein [Polaromonas sp.]MDP1740202.1 hypothetical protein [Polaromonas sp.]
MLKSWLCLPTLADQYKAGPFEVERTRTITMTRSGKNTTAEQAASVKSSMRFKENLIYWTRPSEMAKGSGRMTFTVAMGAERFGLVTIQKFGGLKNLQASGRMHSRGHRKNAKFIPGTALDAHCQI